MMKNVTQYNVHEMSVEDTIKVEGGFRIYNINHIYFQEIPALRTMFVINKPQLYSNQF
jgi:hypothetical protein